MARKSVANPPQTVTEAHVSVTEEGRDLLAEGMASIIAAFEAADLEDTGKAPADGTYAYLAELNRLWSQPQS